MIAVVVPTNRPECMERFRSQWGWLIDGADTHLIEVWDDKDVPYIKCGNLTVSLSLAAGSWKEVVFSHTDAVRNFGFLYALRRFGSGLRYIVTLDDDVSPLDSRDGSNNAIEDHIQILQSKVPISWFSTASEYMRGFPYGVREEADVWVSHGAWGGVHDYDGPTQLVNGNKPARFYKGPIPRGCLFPMCGMNLAFKVEALPYMYFAPMGKSLGVQRFGDIWMGIRAKCELDKLNKAVVTGYSTVHHDRASNVLDNLEYEVRGICWNEHYWQGTSAGPEFDAYFKRYDECYEKWQDVVGGLLL